MLLFHSRNVEVEPRSAGRKPGLGGRVKVLTQKVKVEKVFFNVLRGGIELRRLGFICRRLVATLSRLRRPRGAPRILATHQSG